MTFSDLLPRLGDVVALDRQQLDLSRPDEIRRVVREIHPDLIVNAAAYTAVDQAEKEESLAEAINAARRRSSPRKPKESARRSFTIPPTTSSTAPRIPRTRKTIARIR